MDGSGIRTQTVLRRPHGSGSERSEPEEMLSGSLGRASVFSSARKMERPSPSSPPRSPNTRPLVFHSRRSNDCSAIPTVRASGTPHGSRSGSERAGKVGRGPVRRSRGSSETENSARWENNIMQCLALDNIWYDKHRYDEAERRFYAGANGPAVPQQGSSKPSSQLKGRPQKRPHRNSSSQADQELQSRMKTLELENQRLYKEVEQVRAALLKLDARVAFLEEGPVVKVTAAEVENGDDDDDIDLFGSDEEDEEAERLKQERLEAYAAKKAKKPALIAKSSILLDVKPWDDETDMVRLEQCVRSVQIDGLLWGASKLVPVGYGIKKLQINCVVEDDKVGTDILEEEITKFEDFVQSVDVAAFNKI